MANTPIIKKRCGAFSVSVFEETKQSKSGDSYISHSIVLQKSYKDQNGNWQRQSINMFDNNAPEVAFLLQSAWNDMINSKGEPMPTETKDEPVAKEPEIDDSLPF